MERIGKSHITYKPYGEILRTDSYGPDITKFKYTGQEEDRESGLYYYKARYYDAALRRFASNDGMSFPKKPQGMNRMMYVEGNPMKWKDATGNIISANLFKNFKKGLFGNSSIKSITKQKIQTLKATLKFPKVGLEAVKSGIQFKSKVFNDLRKFRLARYKFQNIDPINVQGMILGALQIGVGVLIIIFAPGPFKAIGWSFVTSGSMTFVGSLLSADQGVDEDSGNGRIRTNAD